MSQRSATTARADVERLLEEFVTAYDKAFQCAAEAVGLSGAQACTLARTQVRQPMSSLAHEAACDASNVSQIIARLEGRGFVERTADDLDRRVKNVAITPAGRRTHRRVRSEFAFGREALARLDAGEREQLHALLSKMLEAEEQATHTASVQADAR